ncbi:MAG: molybdopterin molybdenumtransferase MoeA [Betaproteobacteria bacterium]|jgi:molybdopterin molybdotransferase|uniref:molybdopterin molybdotransferase MoeA n=1 Tax=Limnobacter sp. TaxID=2003368 RepID=UPI000DB39B93|nr:MAG: molybdopterin molybdenumtransferase MoeA [Betaproteobacteria bacterium]PZO21355.1 MAG: molybdopterin molybdenumtransferase MoeA [Betaproteobacteria bacterium]
METDFQTVEQARLKILSLLKPITGTRTVAIREALDQVLAADLLSPINVPAHDNSAMDGYAFNSSNIQNSDITHLTMIGTAYAGKAFTGTCGNGECVRIMTGAVMPLNCDTVLVQENATVSGDQISFPPGAVKAGDNRRLAGEDLTIGKPALPAGKVLRPADLGLLASLGVAEISVRRKLRVAFFSTGDELRSLGQPLDEGCVYDSNRYTLYGMLTRLRFIELLDMGVVHDSPEALEHAMLQAMEQADVILTSGGVSVGEADYTKQVMEKLGSVNFWKIAMRPGRPMAFGQVHNAANGDSAYLFGLPGNPVAVMVTFYAFVRDALFKLANANALPIPMVSAKLAQNVRKRPGRTEYQRARLTMEKGLLLAHLSGAQGSGILRSMSESDGLLVLEHDQGDLKAGDTVLALPFEGLI